MALADLPAPVFILAPPFCGAAYLAAMLGRHPQLYAVPELNLFMADRVDELLEIFHLSQGPHADGLMRALAQLEFGEQSDAGVALARQWLQVRAQWSTGAVVQHLARRALPRRLVVPDAEAPLRPIDLQRLRRQLPGVGVIHLLRHPWTQGVLHARWLDGRLFVAPDFKDHSRSPPLIDPQIGWLRCNLNIDRALPPDEASALRLRGEEFDEEILPALGRVARWLDVDDTPAALAPMQRPEDWVFAGYGPPAAPYGLEAEVLEEFPDALVQLATRDARLDAPLPWRGGEGFSNEVVDLALRYGYV